MPVRIIFEQPTIAGLAAWLVEEQRRGGGAQLPPIQAAPREQPPPLSFAQQRLWFIDQLEEGSPLYNIVERVEVEGALDVDLLRRSFERIAARHEILRTTFTVQNGQAVQVVHPVLLPQFTTIDLSGFCEQEQDERLRQLTAEAAGKGFDLAAGPLLRVTAVRRAGERHSLLVVMHHIITDGWSTAILIREFCAIYRALAANEPPNLPDLPLQYADFAIWQRQWLSGEPLRAHLDYWKEKLAGIPPRLDLLFDRPRPALQSSAGDLVPFRIPAELTLACKRLSQQQNCSLFMTMLAAFQTLLYRYSGQEVICVGNPIANRTRAEIEGLIGCFINTLVQRADFSPEMSFVDLLHQVRQTALRVFCASGCAV